MQAVHYNDLVSRFSKLSVDKLKWLSPLEQIKSLIVEKPQEPENLKNTFFDANDIYVHTKHETKKKPSTKEYILGKKSPEPIHKQEEDHSPTANEQRKKVYKAGTFALFHQLNNENKLDKDQEVWYYKEHKDIIGPVSSYNMDKMAYYKNIDDQTRVAYKSVDKFVKFSKIKKIVESNKKTEEEQGQDQHQNEEQQ